MLQARKHTENIQSKFSTLSGIVIVLFKGAKQKVAWENGRRFSALQGTLWSDDGMAGKTSLKKWIYVLPVFTSIIPTHFFNKK